LVSNELALSHDRRAAFGRIQTAAAVSSGVIREDAPIQYRRATDTQQAGTLLSSVAFKAASLESNVSAFAAVGSPTVTTDCVGLEDAVADRGRRSNCQEAAANCRAASMQALVPGTTGQSESLKDSARTFAAHAPDHALAAILGVDNRRFSAIPAAKQNRLASKIDGLGPHTWADFNHIPDLSKVNGVLDRCGIPGDPKGARVDVSTCQHSK